MKIKTKLISIVFLIIACMLYSSDDASGDHLMLHKGNGKTYKMSAYLKRDSSLLRLYENLTFYGDDNSFELNENRFIWVKSYGDIAERAQYTEFAGNYKNTGKELLLTILKMKEKSKLYDLKDKPIVLNYALELNDNDNLKMSLTKISDPTGDSIEVKELKYDSFTKWLKTANTKLFFDSEKLSDIAKKNRFKVYNVKNNKELVFFINNEKLYDGDDINKYFNDLTAKKTSGFDAEKNFEEIGAEIKNNNLQKLKKLVSKDTDLNYKAGNGMTSFIFACYLNRVEIAKFLLEKGADVNAKTKEGLTSLMLASGNGNLDTVKFLVDNSADVNDKNSDGQAALLVAAGKGYLNIVKYLADKGADVNAKDNNGDTALLYSSDFGNTDIVKVLIEHKADVNIRNKDGDSALFWAKHNKHEQIIKLLIKEGAKE
jgi:ankyrin repeat protein